MTAKAILGVALLAALACGGKATGSGMTITDRDWELVAIGDKPAPLGAGSKPVTLRLDAEQKRATGFGGCNRYSGSFEQKADQLTFGPMAATKMACTQGTQIEDAYLPALGTTQSWELADGVLLLKAAGVPILRFRESVP